MRRLDRKVFETIVVNLRGFIFSSTSFSRASRVIALREFDVLLTFTTVFAHAQQPITTIHHPSNSQVCAMDSEHPWQRSYHLYLIFFSGYIARSKDPGQLPKQHGIFKAAASVYSVQITGQRSVDKHYNSTLRCTVCTRRESQNNYYQSGTVHGGGWAAWLQVTVAPSTE